MLAKIFRSLERPGNSGIDFMPKGFKINFKKMEQKINEIEINGVKYIPKDSANYAPAIKDGLPWVLIRSYASGVHFGLLESEKFTESGKVVVLRKSRRIHSWQGACSCSQIAVDGIKSGNVSVEVDSIEIVNCIETISLTEAAIKNLCGISVWKK